MTNPRFPRKHTLQAMTLLALHDNAGAGITHRTVDRMCDSYRLASYKGSLGKKGWDIWTESAVVSCFHGSRNSTIKIYRLTDEHAALLRTPEGAAFIKSVRDYYENAKAGGNRLVHKANTTNTTSTDISTGGML